MGTRDDLVTAAAALLDAGGAEGVTLRAVGARAGVSHNAPYKHFADKQALLAAVAAREADRMAADLAVARAELGPLGALRRILLELVGWARRYPQRFFLVFGPWTVPDADLERAAGGLWRDVVRIAEQARDAGELQAGDPERTAALLRAVAHGATDLALTGHLAVGGKGNASAEDLVDDVFALLRRASGS